MAERTRWLRRESFGFAVGAFLFALGAVPAYASWVGVQTDNVTYFIGSLFFTTAGGIQLFLAGGRRPPPDPTRTQLYDWWASAIQSVGTLFFNVSTGVALVKSLTADEAYRHVWRPDALGSICFLVASAIAVVAISRVVGAWRPASRDWSGTWLNMLGSIAFGVSAVAAYVVPTSGDDLSASLADSGTLIGALCFLVAALVVLPPKEVRAATPAASP